MAEKKYNVTLDGSRCQSYTISGAGQKIMAGRTITVSEKDLHIYKRPGVFLIHEVKPKAKISNKRTLRPKTPVRGIKAAQTNPEETGPIAPEDPNGRVELTEQEYEAQEAKAMEAEVPEDAVNESDEPKDVTPKTFTKKGDAK